MAASSAVRSWISGRISIRCASTSHDLELRRTMPMWNRSMPRCDGNVSMRTGSSHCMKPKNELRSGGGSITRVARTEHSKIGHQRNLPRRSRRIIYANSWSSLETHPKLGTRTEDRPSAGQSHMRPGPDWPGQVTSAKLYGADPLKALELNVLFGSALSRSRCASFRCWACRS